MPKVLLTTSLVILTMAFAESQELLVFGDSLSGPFPPAWLSDSLQLFHPRATASSLASNA